MVRETTGGLVKKTNPSGHEHLLGTRHARARKSVRCCRKSRQFSGSPLEPHGQRGQGKGERMSKDSGRFCRGHNGACGSVLGLP